MLYPAHTDGSHRTPHPPLSSFPARTPLPGRPPPLPLSAQRLTAPCRSPHALSLILGFRELRAKLPHMPINTRHRPPYKTPNARPDHYRLRQTDIIRSPHGSFPALAPRPFAHLASPLPLLALLPTTPCPLTPLLLPCAFVRPLPLRPFSPRAFASPIPASFPLPPSRRLCPRLAFTCATAPRALIAAGLCRLLCRTIRSVHSRYSRFPRISELSVSYSQTIVKNFSRFLRIFSFFFLVLMVYSG